MSAAASTTMLGELTWAGLGTTLGTTAMVVGATEDDPILLVAMVERWTEQWMTGWLEAEILSVPQHNGHGMTQLFGPRILGYLWGNGM